MIHNILNAIDDIKENRADKVSVTVSLNSTTWYPLAIKYASKMIFIRNTRKALLVFDKTLGAEGLYHSIADMTNI